MESNQPPRLAACWFGADIYRRMARVLEFSARRHCPQWRVDVMQIRPGPMPGRLRMESLEANSQKLMHWTTQVLEAKDGERLLLIDGDTAVLNPLDPVWDRAFDLAYTVRPEECRLPFNSGVVFVRVSPRVRAFFARWCDENMQMLDDPTHHATPRQKYGGINQAAFGTLLEGDHGLAIESLPCAEWNCEDSVWPFFESSRVRIVHIKSALRSVALGLEATVPRAEQLLPIAQIWRRLERAAKAETAL